jgi:hypothetical protein
VRGPLGDWQSYRDGRYPETYRIEMTNTCDLFCFIEKNAGVIITFIGLLWAVGSFWWMHWHKGKVIVGAPRTYAALSHQRDDFLLVRLPLVFYNTGAATIVVQNLRLMLEHSGKQSPVLYFNQTVPKLDVEQEREWAKQFPVEGREAVSLICEFLRKPRNGFDFAASSCNAVLEGKFDSDENWKIVTKFKLRTPEEYLNTLNSNGPLIPYDNDPDRES